MNAGISFAEKLLFEDFQNYIFSVYPVLFPYDTFEMCKGNKNLMESRIKILLEDMVINKDNVDYHRGWANKIRFNNELINQIDFPVLSDAMYISMLFGSTIPISKKLFTEISYSNFHWALANQWIMKPETRICNAFGSLLVTIECKKEKEFVQYWKNNMGNIKQYSSKESFKEFINELKKQDFLEFNEKTERLLEEKIYNTNRTQFTIMPTLLFEYQYSEEDLISLEQQGILQLEIVKKVTECLFTQEMQNSFTDLIKDEYKIDLNNKSNYI